MSESKQPIEHLSMTGGMDRSTEPHLIDKDCWWTQLGMRVVDNLLTQIPPRRIQTQIIGDSPITAIVPVNILGTTNNSVYLFGQQNVYRFRGSNYETLINTGTNPIQPTPERWATCVYGERVYFTNLNNPLRYVNSSTVIVQATAEVLPAGRYLTEYFDHLVISNVNFNGTYPVRTIWSALRDFGSFNPSRASEADYYDHMQGGNPAISGVTGQALLNDRVIIYSASCIYSMQYTGLPRVMRIDPIFVGAGNDFPWAVANVADKLHFFISLQYRNFFQLSGEGSPKPIGDKIINYFLNDLNPDTDMQATLWSYVDLFHNEVWWVYPSINSTGAFDKAVIYNFKQDCWYVSNVEKFQAFCGKTRIGRTVADLAGIQIQNLNSTCQKLSSEVARHQKMWVGDSVGGSNLYIEVLATDTPFIEGDLLDESSNFLLTEGSDNLIIDGGDATQASTILLESGDFIYGLFEDVKEVESICIQADLGTSTGLQVSIAARSNLLNVSYVPIKQIWVPTLREGRLSRPRAFGRAIRYQFQPIGTNVVGFTFSLYTENILGGKDMTEK